jgi:hypothetical protein
MRGYIDHQRIMKELSSTKLEQTFAYFDSIKNAFLTDSQIKISYIWRKYNKSSKKQAKIKQKKKESTKKNLLKNTMPVRKNR